MIHGNVECGASVHVPKMRIAFVLQEVFRDVVTVVVESDHHRCGALRRRQIDIGSRINQRIHALQAAATCGVQERREATKRVILRARF